jgi:hypothetical protein
LADAPRSADSISRNASINRSSAGLKSGFEGGFEGGFEASRPDWDEDGNAPAAQMPLATAASIASRRAS